MNLIISDIKRSGPQFNWELYESKVYKAFFHNLLKLYTNRFSERSDASVTGLSTFLENIDSGKISEGKTILIIDINDLSEKILNLKNVEIHIIRSNEYSGFNISGKQAHSDKTINPFLLNNDWYHSQILAYYDSVINKSLNNRIKPINKTY